jgi:hypothetical protein
MLNFLVALALFSVSYSLTRLASIILSFVVWFGFIALVWRLRLLRFALLGITFLLAGFLAWPSTRTPPIEALRSDYLAGLQRYEGAAYYWGGESTRGIDCSGLIRRGLIDALFWRGMRSLNPSLVRRAISLWWHDCTASALRDQHRGLTVPVSYTSSVNALDYTNVLPGDLATNGIHVMAYLGNNRWIEADPGVGRVITVVTPSSDNPWFHTSMNIVRWTILR